MSVYTAVNQAELEKFLQRYSVGEITGYRGIDEGIENTNYFVETNPGACGDGRYVLTIFEWQNPADLPRFLELMTHLADAGLPCPRPIADDGGRCLQILCGKPAVLVTRLKGRSVHSPGPDHCRQVGEALAAIHHATGSFTPGHSDRRGRQWREQCVAKVLPRLADGDARLLEEENRRHAKIQPQRLPRGTIHADLFRDNVLFDGARLSGVIDLYYACVDDLVYDLAIAVNDWCSREDGSLDRDNYLALVNAYAERRPFSDGENEAWADTLRRAALRFWLSRLHDAHFPRAGQITHTKDTDVFKSILLHRRREHPQLC